MSNFSWDTLCLMEVSMDQKPKKLYKSIQAESKKKQIKKIKKSPRDRELLGRYVQKKYSILLSEDKPVNDYEVYGEVA